MNLNNIVDINDDEKHLFKKSAFLLCKKNIWILGNFLKSVERKKYFLLNPF